MKINDMTKADLELLSYSDIAFLLLNETKKTMNTPTLFKKICEMLEYSDDEYTNKVGEFYTSLTNDKRFVMLDSAEWDLRDNHAIKINFDEDEEEDNEIDDENLDEEKDDIDESIDEVDIEEPLDDEELELDDDDDIDDLTVIDDEELEE